MRQGYARRPAGRSGLMHLAGAFATLVPACGKLTSGLRGNGARLDTGPRAASPLPERTTRVARRLAPLAASLAVLGARADVRARAPAGGDHGPDRRHPTRSAATRRPCEVAGDIAAPTVSHESYVATTGSQTLVAGGTNVDWAKLVLVEGDWPVTEENVTFMMRWMRQENGADNWWNRNNPLNNGQGSGGGSGLGSYPTLVEAAFYAAQNLQSGRYPDGRRGTRARRLGGCDGAGDLGLGVGLEPLRLRHPLELAPLRGHRGAALGLGALSAPGSTSAVQPYRARADATRRRRSRGARACRRAATRRRPPSRPRRRGGPGRLSSSSASAASSSRTRSRSVATSFSRSSTRRMPSRLTPSLEQLGDLAQLHDVAHRVAARLARRCAWATTSPSRSYCRSVCGCMPASSAAIEITKSGLVSSMPLATVAVSPAPWRAGRRAGSRRAGAAANSSSVSSRLLREVRRHGDLHDGEQVARALRRRDAAALDAQHAAARRARRDAQLHGVAAEGRHLDGGAERGLDEGDRHVDAQVQPVALEHRVLAHRAR